MRICTIDGCSIERKTSKLYCEKHRGRIRRHGDPTIALKDHTPAVERWKYSYKVDEKTGCWIWQRAGSVEFGGYGGISNGRGNFTAAHKFVYEQVVGPVPDGLELDHLCENKGCVNPEHLEPVTHSENVRRAYASTNPGPRTDHHAYMRETMRKRRAALRSDPHLCNRCGGPIAGTFKTCEECRLAKREAYKSGGVRTGTLVSAGGQRREVLGYCDRGHAVTNKSHYRNSKGELTCRQCGGVARQK